MRKIDKGRFNLILIALAFAVMAGAGVFYFVQGARAPETGQSAVPDLNKPAPDKTAGFNFKKHWSQPIAPQGAAPADFSDMEKSLFPKDCGECHEEQFNDWRESRHSKAVSPGFLGQLNPPWLNRESIENCLNCHAPLSEQRIYAPDENGEFVINRNRQSGLLHEGLTCAGCHVRKHVRFGPTPKEAPEPPLPHNGFVEVKNFGASEFCRPCHQFEKFHRRVAGKLVEDTYEQWRASEYASKGIQCADCHMPARRHLWKGIHDPEMVKAGVDINAWRDGSNVTVSITNKGVGHLFPTYVTPQVVIQASHTSNGEKKVVEESWIGWYVEIDLSGERFDTRIAPGESHNYLYQIPDSPGEFKVDITVYPDEFYNRFFKALIKNPPQGVDTGMLAKAVKETEESSYKIFEKSWTIKTE